jgi:O-antigen/teichoic acid export membrane protein
MAVVNNLMMGLIFLVEQTDQFIFAKFLFFTTLGTYTIAYSLAIVLKQVIKQFNGSGISPVVSQNASMPRSDLRLKTLSRKKIIVFPLALGLAPLA